MLNFLFPTAVYSDEDPSFVDIANRWFDKAKFYTGPRQSPKLRTTLIVEGYTPGGAPVTFDPSQEPEWPGWNQFVTYHVKQYLNEQRYKPYGVQLVNTWLNEVEAGGIQGPHDHTGYNLSGVYYPHVPEGSGRLLFHSDKDKGKAFLHGIEVDTPATCPNWWIPVKTGTVLIFSSDVVHSVPNLEFEGVRRSIAFDIVLKWQG